MTASEMMWIVDAFRAIEHEDAVFREILFSVANDDDERDYWYVVFDLLLNEFIKEGTR